ncbi:MAG TPA: hypothetical protein VFP65_05370 [Anaeromyxobacteraceae bacterium]|nr:hypothetical protein [Anaeromyxobacteraceae bacterium]
MDIDLTTILVVVLVPTLLTILLTGPGMWSEKWGWGWFEEKRRRPPKEGGRPRPPG